MTYSLVIGRFQPVHDGHVRLVRTLLDEGRNVLVACRCPEEPDDANPYTFEERWQMWQDALPLETAGGRVCVIGIPDIDEVVYGRKVGWGIREIRLDDATEAISATAIRERGE